jgi:hypothetical protein
MLRSRSDRKFLFDGLFLEALLVAAASFEPLAVNFPPMERLGGLLLALQTLKKTLFFVRPAEAVVAEPKLPPGPRFPVGPGDLTTNELRLSHDGDTQLG